MRAVVVGCIELELHPCRGDLRPALQPTFEVCGERYEDCFARIDVCGFKGVREVGACGAVAVPEVVIEEVGTGFGGLVG